MTQRCETCGQSTPDFYPSGLCTTDVSVTRNGVEVPLTRSEMRLFKTLLGANGETCSSEFLMGDLYTNRASHPHANILKVLACKMRKRLGAIGVQIVPVRGVGYRMLVDDAEEENAA